MTHERRAEVGAPGAPATQERAHSVEVEQTAVLSLGEHTSNPVMRRADGVFEQCQGHRRDRKAAMPDAVGVAPVVDSYTRARAAPVLSGRLDHPGRFVD
jgi:hypothetical protein